MKTVLLVAAALCGWAVYAHAADGYSDPSDFRAPGITIPTSAVTITMADTNPFGMSTPGASYGKSDVTIVMSDTNPFGMVTPGTTYGNSGGRLASQAAK